MDSIIACWSWFSLWYMAGNVSGDNDNDNILFDNIFTSNIIYRVWDKSNY